MSASPTGTERIRPVALTGVAFLDLVGLAEDHRTDRVLVEVQREAERAALELEQLVDRGLGQPGDAGDAVADLEHPADARRVERRRERLDVLAQRGRDLVGVDRVSSCHRSESCSFIWSSR